ncbi:hypothetical protein CMI47_10375 [Candidatus Pacearchaeota archaeon]|nr:hypothetical protein [Candidatus Pacearchaeota archaeon]
MGIKRYLADADNTIVNAYRQNLKTRGTGANMGAADVVETFSIYGRVTTSSAGLSRILMKFPISDISTDRDNAVLPASGNVSYYLRMFNAKHSKTVPTDYTLVMLAVSQSWQEGIGLDLEDYKDLTYGNEGSNWMSASNTAYWTDNNGTLLAGGSYHTGSSDTETFIFTQSMSTGLENVEVDITPLVEQWIAGTYDNYGIGVHLSASYEAYESGSANDVVSRMPGELALDAEDDTQSVIYNPSGSTISYFTKRFFARGTQYFFKRPVIEARWNDRVTYDRGEFFYSSSLAPAADNLNTLYLYNYVRGRLKDIPGLGTDKRIYVSIYSGSTGGFYKGGDGDDVPPSNTPVSGTTGSVQILSADNNGNVNTTNLLVVTGGIVSTGIYSCSFAFTGSDDVYTIYDVWFTGSDTVTSANDASAQYFTGTIKPMKVNARQTNDHPIYYLNVTNLETKYPSNQTARFNIHIRKKYWSPNIYTVANSTVPTDTIPSASYMVYRTLDALNVIPYGTGSELHTGLSYDVSGNYFDLDMKLLEAGYEYAFKFSFYNQELNSWTEQEQAFKFRVEDYEY